MSCIFQKNEKGEIIRVLDKNGNESKLYNKIASHPLIEDALTIYKNTLSDKFKDLDENQITLTHRVSGEIISNLKTALKSAQENSPIEIGFEVEGKFTKLYSISKNTNLENELGFVQAGILDGLISQEKVDGKFQAEGKSRAKKATSLNKLKEKASPTLGSKALVVDDNTFTISKILGVNTFYSKGEEVVVSDAELAAMSEEDIRKKFDNPTDIIAERVLSQNIPLKRGSKLPTDVVIKDESELTNNLLNLLNKMGISVVSMENYTKNYTVRHGVNPSAEALADISNQVVAILEGRETLDNLLEETTHFIVEALPQERLENILRNIHKSEEFKESYEIQKAIYENEYSGEELETVVRKEILGKILKNAVSQSQEKSETQQNFFNSAVRLIQDFFRDIINYFQPQYKQELDSLIEDVQNLIAHQDISSLDLDNFKGNEKRFYNATQAESDAIVKAAQKNIDIYLKLERDLSRSSRGNNFNVKELRQAQIQLEQAYNVNAVAKINSITANVIKILNAALEDSKINNKTFDLSQEENVVYGNLTNGVKEGLAVLKELIETKNIVTDKEKILAKNLENTITNITELEAKRTVASNDALEKMFRAVTTDKGLSEKEFQAMMQWATRAKNDINWVNATFGTLYNSSDALASIYATKKTAMQNRASQKSHSMTKAFQAALRKLGFDEKWVSTLVKDGYFESELNIAQYLKDREANFKKAYDEVIPNNKLSLEELLKKRREGSLEWTPQQQNEIEDKEKTFNDLISERQMVDEYYTELEKKYEGASKETVSALRSLGSERNKLRNKARTADNRIDISLLSKQDLASLQVLEESRKKMKSPISFDGQMKEFLKYERNAEGEQILVSEVSLDELPLESRIAYDINMIDNQGFVGREGEFSRSKAFDDLVLSKATREESVRALKLNSSILFSNEFWDTFQNTQTIKERLNSVKNSDNEELIDNLIADIEEVNARKKALIKAHTKSNNPSETDVESMSALTRAAIKELEETAEGLREQTRILLKDTTAELNTESISGANEAWNDSLIDNDLVLLNDSSVNNMQIVASIINLAKKHMTAKNVNAVTDAESNVRNFRAGKIVRLSKSVDNALERQGLTKEQLKDDFIAAQFLKNYTEDRLLSYYKRFTPASYVEFQNDLSNEEVSTEEILNKEYKYLQITPNYSFDEEDTSMVNPNYTPNSRMGFAQPKKSLYENKAFTSKYGKIVRDNNGYYVSAEKNQKEFEAYKTVMNFRFQQLDTMEAGASYNNYITPQIRKQTIERWLGSIQKINGQSIKDAFENAFTFTEDDQAQGDSTFGAQNKIIPRQYFSKLENQSDITSDIFHGLILTNNAANLYESRLNFYGDFMAILDVARNRETTGTNKETTATNRFKTIESAVDNDLFGIRQVVTDTVLGKDTAKIIDSMGAYLRFKALGFSVAIPATAYVTSKIKQTVERIVGERINKDSFNRGNKEFTKQLSKASSEIGKLHSTAELNVKGEYWQAFELENRLYGSKFNALQRYLSKSSHVLFQAATYPIYGKNMYSVLHDYRIVDGKMVKFTDFKRNEKIKNYNISNKEIQDKWNKEDVTLNSLHSTNEDGQVVWDKMRLKELLKDEEGNQYSDEALDSKLLEIVDDVRIQIKNLNVAIDLQLSHEDKVAAHRHYLLNFLLSFKSFMIPLAEERFKKTGFNTQSRQVEGGSYTSIYELGRDILKEWRTNGGKFMEAFKNQYNGNFTELKADIEKLKAVKNRTPEQEAELKTLTEDLVRGMEFVEFRHSSMKRLGVDLLVLNSMIALMMVVRGLADDDKDNYSLQLAHYLVQRATGEINSASVGIASNYYDVANAPLQGFRLLTDVSKLPKAYENGTLPETIAKSWLPFASSYNQMVHPEAPSDAMRYYNEVQGDAYVLSPIYHMMNKE